MAKPTKRPAKGAGPKKSARPDPGIRAQGAPVPGGPSRNVLLAGAAAAIVAVAGIAYVTSPGAGAPGPSADAADAGADADELGAVLGGRLAEAVAAASASAPPSGAAAPVSGPPPGGIFAQGAAEKVQPTGAPPKVELVDAGAEPHRSLAVPPAAGETRVALRLAVRLGAQGIPTLDLGLALRPEARGEPERDAGAAASTPAALSARVVAATLSAQQPGVVGNAQQAGALVAKLVGSQIRFSRSAEGALFAPKVELAKGAEPQLETALRAAGEAITMLTPAYPQKPVGQGATWMVTDRAGSLGVEVVRYRAFKIEKIEGDAITLSLDVRQYADAEKKLNLPGVPPDMVLAMAAFDSAGKGQVFLGGQGPVPSGELSLRALTQIKPPEGAGARAPVFQTEIVAKIGTAG